MSEEDLLSQDIDNSQNTPAEWRRLVVGTINRVLSDLDRVQPLDQHEDFHTSFEFILNACQRFPQLFAIMPEERNGSDPDQEYQRALSNWIARHTIRILTVLPEILDNNDHSVEAFQKCAELKDKIRTVVYTLIHVARTYNVQRFLEMIREVVQCIKDTCSALESFFRGSEEQEDDPSVPLRCFQNAANVGDVVRRDNIEMAEPGLELNGVDPCLEVLIVLVGVMKDMMVSSFQFTELLPVLWPLALKMIELGDLELKIAALEFERMLLEFSRQTLPVLLRLTEAVCATARLAASGLDDRYGLVETLEAQMCESMTNLQESREIFYIDELTVNNYLFKNLTDVIIDCGFSNFKGQTTRTTLVTSLITCCRKMCLKSLEHHRSVVLTMLKVCKILVNVVVTSSLGEFDETFVKCCQDLFFQVIKSEVEVHLLCYKLEKEQTSEQKTILEMRELQADDKDISLVSSHLLKVLLELLLKLETPTTAEGEVEEMNRHYNAKHLLDIIAWLYETLALSSSLVLNSDRSEEPSSCRPLLCDESQRILSAFFRQLSDFSATSRELAVECYDLLVSVLVSMIYVNDFFEMDYETCSFIVGLASIPWLSSEVSTMDLKLKNHKNAFFKISEDISDDIGENTLRNCVYLLCSVSKAHLAHQFRFNALQKAWSDTRANVRRAVIENMVVARHRISSFGLSYQLELLESGSDGLCEATQVAVVKVLSGIMCSLCGQISILRPTLAFSEDIDVIRYDFFFICCQCSSSSDVENKLKTPVAAATSTSSFPPLSHIQSILKLLKNLFRSKYDSVRLEMAKNMLYWAVHVYKLLEMCKMLPVDFLDSALSLMKDPNYEVRSAFSDSMQHLLPKKDGREPIEVIVTKWINEQVDVSVSHAPYSDTILNSLSHMSRTCDGELLMACISITLNVYLFPTEKSHELLAEKHLKLICGYHKITIQQLFKKFCRDICKAVANCLYETKLMRPTWDAEKFLAKVSGVFLFDSAQDFLRNNENFLIPLLVSRADATASFLIKCITNLIEEKNHVNCIIRNGGRIFSHLVTTTRTATEQTKIYNYLEKETGLTFHELIDCSSFVDSYLLISLSDRYEQVIQGLKVWAHAKGLFNDSGITAESCTDSELADRLQPNLLGVLVNFDKHIIDVGTSMNEKMKAYRSLMTLMEFMGERHVTQVRIRLMKTLKIGLQFKDEKFGKLCCEVWSTFVRIVNLSALGPMLTQVVVCLLPLLNQFPTLVAKIFQYLVVDSREKLHEHLGDLYFMPSNPELAQVNAVLKLYLEGEYSCKDLPLQMERLLRGVNHDSLEVRQMALIKLRDLLKTSKTALHNLIVGSEAVDSVVSKTVATLLQSCRDPDPTARNLIGQCLGEVGAIDPGRLELLGGTNRKVSAEQPEMMDGEGFWFLIINEMTKAFLRVEDALQDCVAYALQELMKLFQIEMGDEKWSQFSEDAVEILMPLRSSRYKVNMIRNWSDLEKPVYGSKKGKSFDRWICTLTGYLGSMMSSDWCRGLFDKCFGVLRLDQQLSLFLLPSICVQILLEANEDHCNMLLQEILTILNDCKSGASGRDRGDEERRPDDASCITSSDIRHTCAQTCFSLLDFITRWLRHQTILKTIAADSGSTSKTSVAASAPTDIDTSSVKTFLSKVPQHLLAMAAYNCGSYGRSLRHYEMHVRSSNAVITDSSETTDFLMKLYIALDEPDGVAGLMAIQQVQPSLVQQIHSFESVGCLSDASTCYDRAIQLDPTNLVLKKGLLKNRLAHGELNSVLNLTNGMINADSTASQQLNKFRVEAAWKLGQWDKLEEFLQSENQSCDWNVGLGKLLTFVKSKDSQSFSDNITPLRLSLIIPLSAASAEVGSYCQGYENIVRLHMLSELEDGANYLFDRHSVEPMETDDKIHPGDRLKEQLIPLWLKRLELCQHSYKTISPILDLHRVLLQLIKEETGAEVDVDISHCWLMSARIARECGLIQTAHSSLLNAGEHHMAEFCMEKATWLWDKGDFEESRSCLEKVYKVLSEKVRANKSNEKEKIDLSKLLLQLTRYSDETSSLESFSISKMFKEVIEYNENWEDCYFYNAKYHDKILSNASDSDKRGRLIQHMVSQYLQSLLYGSHYIYQSLPRLLTLWLDFAAEKLGKEDEQTLAKINKVIIVGTTKLSTYQFLVVLPQLISRICHPRVEVFNILKDIVVKVMKDYPQQTMWLMIAVSKSSFHIRKKRCQEIFHKARSSKSELVKFLQDATSLADYLINLCNENVKESGPVISMSKNFKPLLRLLNDTSLSNILMPLQNQMIPSLPNVPMESSVSYNPFPCAPVYIVGVEDKADILTSLQKPKKVTFKGSDGNSYVMLCKPKDDLRKDSRLMEFTSFVNRCLKKNPDARRKNLHIRTFTVTPLDENCGMLEWVSNTNGLRPILLKLYKEKGIYASGAELKSYVTAPSEALTKKLAIYREKLLPRHPPVFSEWFLKTFPDPTSWYGARQSYCRTAAVMSMVGYILGLGDRHGENLLLDSTCGDVVHVDFSCLFNKGETFDYPELVPFRLTHNMIEAMGPLGYEGIFRKSCEVTLKVMRDEMDSLMSILKTFIFDPLVEWEKPAAGRGSSETTGEIRNGQAQTHVSNIEGRLRGSMKVGLGLPLSVEGHVSSLIKKATDENNLCQMYIGWASYL